MEKKGTLNYVGPSKERTSDRRILHVWKCDCGNECLKTIKAVNRSKHPTCGCKRVAVKRKEKTAKGHALYRTYNGMLTRCYNKNHQAYHRYGERGIDVCNRWRTSFWNFVEDVGERPKGKTLDRVDNNLGYSPDNFRWATPKEQGENRGY